MPEAEKSETLKTTSAAEAPMAAARAKMAVENCILKVGWLRGNVELSSWIELL